MGMLRWMCEVTNLDKIRNEGIRGSTKVGGCKERSGKEVEVIYGHVMRSVAQCVGRRAIEMKGHGRRKRGRPKRR